MNADPWDQAGDLAEWRGCVEGVNPCWSECLEAAYATITEDRLDDSERAFLASLRGEETP